MATAGTTRLKASVILFVIILLQVDCKPRIVGETEVTVELGHNVSIECWGNKDLNWYKFINQSKSVESILVDEESHTSHISLEIPEYVDWPDLPHNSNETHLAVLNLQNIKEEEAGTYVCLYESSNMNQMKQRLLNNKTKYFSKIQISVIVIKPTIENGNRIVVNSGQDVNMTCRGEKPVTWVFLSNQTSGVQHTDTREGKMYISVLELRKVNYTDVGYFLCTFVDASKILYEDIDHKSDINTASTYLFVKDLNHLLTLKGVHHVSAQISTELVIPCKPTFPEVDVELVRIDSNSEIKQPMVYSDQRGFIVGSASIAHEGIWDCVGIYRNDSDISDNFMIIVKLNYNPMLPNANVSVGGAWQINSLSKDIHTYDIIEGDVLMINCSAYHRNSLEKIMWTTPFTENLTTSHSLLEFPTRGKIQQTRFVTNASKKDSGNYSCYVTNDHVNSSAYEFALNVFPYESFHLELQAQSSYIILGRRITLDNILWIIFFRAYPELKLTWFFSGEEMIKCWIRKDQIDHTKPVLQRKGRHEIKVNWAEGEIVLKIYSPSVRDVGTYTLLAENAADKDKKNVSLQFIMEGPPEEIKTSIRPLSQLQKQNSEILIVCSCYGYPLPNLTVSFIPCHSFQTCEFREASSIEFTKQNSEYLIKSTNFSIVTGLSEVIWKAIAKEQGIYICTATNSHGIVNSSAAVLTITDSETDSAKELQIEIIKDENFQVSSANMSFIEGDAVTLTCRGNNLKTHPPLGWNAMKGPRKWALIGTKSFIFQGRNISVSETGTKYSYLSVIRTKMITDMDGISLSCSDSSTKPTEETIKISVTEAEHPVWTSEPLAKGHYSMTENKHLSFICSGTGVPSPTVKWYKDGELISADDNEKRISINEGNITFAYLFQEDSGKYSCRIENRVGAIEDFLTLEVLDPNHAQANWFLIPIIAVLSVFVLLVTIYLVVRIFREKRRDKALLLLKQKVFDDGNPESLNPDLDLVEQADLLPYDSKFEFPKERIIFDKIIGSGAFGNVFKATALDIIAGEKKTTVAVKMMKSCTDEAQMKALRSELKIMIHIGRHINIVNLLGACSKNIVSKGELLLIVEYCRHGNILEYMRRHKMEFVDQINDCGKIDASVRHSIRHRGQSAPSRASFRPTYAQLDISSEGKRSSCIDNSGQATFDGPVAFDRRRIKSDSAADEETTVRTDMTIATIDNYPDNYVSETTLEQRGPFCTKDLLHWVYQIANGMFYLSERKVIHGDLAARNILLADKNIVKISDFGLSKNIYKQENYKKKTKGLLPIKWVALEALRDNIFSTQSDVWSFGIVMWEIFSLGQNPYPGIEVDESFIQRLEDGFRLKQPQYATLELFEIMEYCWHAEPNMRPLFKHLEKKLGDMLGETEKQVYITLSAPYEENNLYSEHLKRIRTPTYDSRVQGFFTDETTHIGYEIPVTSGPGGIFMEGKVDFAGEIPKLQQVPAQRKAHLTIGLDENSAETECLINRPDENYLVMTTPSKVTQSQHFTFEDIPMHDRNTALYQNLFHLTDSNKCSAVESIYSHSSSEVLGMNTTDVDRIKEGDGDVEENDSVFLALPEEREQHMEHMTQIHRQSEASPDSRKDFHNSRMQSTSYQQKHDSGLYSPFILQNNPVYIASSDSRLQSTDRGRSVLSSVTEERQHTAVSKARTQSESSSGFGSLGEEKCNSLEKKDLCKLETPLQSNPENFNIELKCT